jgi:hypothetical protein
MCGYAAAYVYSFCMLYCVDRHVDMPLHTTLFRSGKYLLDKDMDFVDIYTQLSDTMYTS